MADAQVDGDRPTGLPNPDEDLIESEAPSSATTALRRRFERLVPPVVSRKVLGGIAAAALVLGLVAGFLVDTVFGSEPDAPRQAQESAGPPGGYIPIVPDGSLLDERIIVAGGLLTAQDLAQLGETALPTRFRPETISESDQHCGIAGSPDTVGLPEEPGEFGLGGDVSFVLAGAFLTERVGPDLDVLAASTLRGRIELARNCPSVDGLTVRTDGIQTGIGNEYALFTLARADPTSGDVQTSMVLLIRVGGRLIELTLSAEDGEVSGGLIRALRIGEVAAARILNG